MEFKLSIKCDNAAFDENPSAEIARILRGVADKVAQGYSPGLNHFIRDANGNRVGEYRIIND